MTNTPSTPLKHLIAFLLTILATTLTPALIAFIFTGFPLNTAAISEAISMVGLFISMVGGIMVMVSYSSHKKKVLKSAMSETIEVKERKGLNWPYILLLAGFVTFVISYFIAVA